MNNESGRDEGQKPSADVKAGDEQVEEEEEIDSLFSEQEERTLFLKIALSSY